VAIARWIGGTSISIAANIPKHHRHNRVLCSVQPIGHVFYKDRIIDMVRPALHGLDLLYVHI
jgi:hypothetical protein